MNRRSFLKSLAGAATLAVLPFKFADAEPDDQVADEQPQADDAWMGQGGYTVSGSQSCRVIISGSSSGSTNGIIAYPVVLGMGAGSSQTWEFIDTGYTECRIEKAEG